MFTTHYGSRVTCHVSRVTFHKSHVTCHMSDKKECKFKIITKFGSKRAVYIKLFGLWYLVRNPVHSAYQQQLFVHGVQCVLYNVSSVYCTRCAVCIVQSVQCVVQGVQCVLYKVCSVYCTLSQSAKSRVNKDNYNIKSNIILPNPVFQIKKL